MSEGEEQTREPAPEAPLAEPASSEAGSEDPRSVEPQTMSEELRAFPGLADLDEDLRTMAQSNAEVERWRRLSTRGLTPATGTTRDELAAPIISPELEAHTATTAPGTVAAPTDEQAVLPSPVRSEPPPAQAVSADATRKLPSIRPETLAALDEGARRSFAPPKDTPSAPPGSRVVLPNEPSVVLPSEPPRRSSRPVKVPRPSRPPDEVHGWRPSDPSEPSAESAEVAIPRPAPLPGAHAARVAASREGAVAPSTPPSQAPAEDRPSLDSTVEVSPWLIVGGLLLAVLVLFTLAYFALL